MRSRLTTNATPSTPCCGTRSPKQEVANKAERAPGRLKQVWFAGMHSNVGGGYPDDSLVLRRARMDDGRERTAAGLRFLPLDMREAPAPRNDFGTMYNSRSGVGSYYRYQPRKIAARLEHPDPTTLMMQDPNRNGVGFLTIGHDLRERVAPHPGGHQLLRADRHSGPVQGAETGRNGRAEAAAGARPAASRSAAPSGSGTTCGGGA